MTKHLKMLAQGGYSRTDMVEMEGELAVRGEVVDIWPAGVEKPWRLLFDGDTLESIREFSSGTQRSEAYLQPQTLLPFRETKPAGNLTDHIPEGTVWFWDDIEPSPGRRPPSPEKGEGTSLSTPSPSSGEGWGEGCSVLYEGLAATGAMDLGYKSTT